MQGCTHNTQGTGTTRLRKANVAPSLCPSIDHSKFLQQGAITMQHLRPKTVQEAPNKVPLLWLRWKDTAHDWGSLKRCSVPHVGQESLHCCSEFQSALERRLPFWQPLRLRCQCHRISFSPEASEKVRIASFFTGSFRFFDYREYLENGIWAGLKGSETRIQIKTNSNLLFLKSKPGW